MVGCDDNSKDDLVSCHKAKAATYYKHQIFVFVEELKQDIEVRRNKIGDNQIAFVISPFHFT